MDEKLVTILRLKFKVVVSFFWISKFITS